MALGHITLLLTLTSSTLCQRPFYAGTRPIGYPQVEVDAGGLGNRFGEGDNTTTTQRLPIEALGDRNLVDRLSKLPIDQQPFWLINWQALEANRKNPQTYPQRPSQFAQPFDVPISATVNSNSASTSTNTGSNTADIGFNSASPSVRIPNTNSASPRTPVPSTNSPNINPSSPLGNRNGDSADISTVNANSFVNPGNELSSSTSGVTNTSISLNNITESSAEISSENANDFTNLGIGISNSVPEKTNVKENPSFSLGNGNEGPTSTDSVNSADAANENLNTSDSNEDDYSEKYKYPMKVKIVFSKVNANW